MKKLFYLGCLLFLISCNKQHITTDQVINSLKLSPATIDADGTGLIDVSVQINSDADVSKRKVVLETSAGSFGTTGLKTITVDALYEVGELIARTKIKSPMSAGYVIVTAKPEVRNAYNDFSIKDSVKAVISLPFSITVSASSFGVQTGYVGEVLITGTLRNSNGKNVSTGAKVIFSDIFLNGTPVGGRFRQVQASSDENSKVTAYYSPGLVAPGTSFYIVVTVLDSAGNPTGITNSVLLTVTP